MVSIEDPFDQDHWDAWTNITAKTSIQVIVNLQIAPTSLVPLIQVSDTSAFLPRLLVMT